MAILAMCIDLMQDQMFTKIKIIIDKLGLGKEYDNEEEIIEENEVTEESEISTKDERTISSGMESKMSKSERLKHQLDSIREKNKTRNLTSAQNVPPSAKSESANWRELLGVSANSKSQMPVVENKRIIVKSLNETTRKANDTEC